MTRPMAKHTDKIDMATDKIDDIIEDTEDE